MSSLENKEKGNPEKLNDWPSQKNSSLGAVYRQLKFLLDKITAVGHRYQANAGRLRRITPS
jgi:hypothetical protein